MRRIILSAVLVVVAVVFQLTVLNGLRLPGGGVPDLVLVIVAALGLASGPVPGAITGFAAGVCLDLAPPGSGLVGEYALVFCLVGWACGRFRGTVTRSAVLPMAIVAAAVVAGEIMVAALGLALQPAQVSFASVRLVLPPSLLYDIAVSPFVLYLVLLAGAWLNETAPAGPAPSASQVRALAAGRAQAGGRQGLTGPVGSAAGGAVLLGLGGWLAGPPQSRRARRAAARRTPRLGPGSGRSGDGWVGGSAAARRALSDEALRGQASRGQAFRGQVFGGGDRRPHGSGAARLRSGVAGSAAGGQAPRALAARPVHLRLASSRKRDGAVGNMLGAGRSLARGRPVVTGRGLSRASMARLGRRRADRGSFRPAAMPGGSAVTRQPVRGHLTAPARPVRLASPRRRDGVVGGGVLTRMGRTGRRPGAPRFRMRSGGPVTGLTRASGAGTQSLQSIRRQAPQPRLRMHARRGDGMLGSPLTGGGRAMSGLTAGGARPAAPRFRARPLASARPMNGKRPRFGYRRWSVLALLTGRRARRLPRGRPGRMGRMGRVGTKRTLFRSGFRRSGGLR